jgi:hypothetical protein
MFTMLSRFLDVAFVIGLLVNLSKLGELALRPHQQKKLQEWSETNTLRLDYFRLPKWFEILRRRKAAGILLLIGFAEFFLVALIAGLKDDQTPKNVHAVQIVAILLSLLSMPYIYKTAGPKYLNWLFADQKTMRFIGRYGLSIAVGFLSLALYQAMLWLLIWLVFHDQDTFGTFFDRVVNMSSPAAFWLMSGLLLLWPPFTFFWIIVQVGGLAVWLVVLLGLSNIALAICRGIAWRLVEYNKGVTAALLLIGTVFIGIVDLAIKTHGAK